MRFTIGTENVDLPRSDYLKLIADLTFLHTFANDTWISVTGDDYPKLRVRMEDALRGFTRQTDSAEIQDAAVAQLNAYFKDGTLLWPFGKMAREIQEIKPRDQSAALDLLLSALDPAYLRSTRRKVLFDKNLSRQRAAVEAETLIEKQRVIELLARIDSLRAENLERLSSFDQRDEAFRKSIDERIGRFEKAAIDAESKYHQELERQRLESLRWIEEKQSELKAISGDMTARAVALKEQADKWQAEKDIEIKNANEANRTSFATQKAHEYWAKTKYNRHTRLADKLFLAGCVYIGSVLCGTVLFLIFGSTLFNQPIWQTPLALVLPLAIAVVALVWLGRILARTYMAHVQLAEDAQERGTMIETYVALIAAGVLDSSKVDEAQRTLFRPGSVGLLAGDSGPDTPIEVISKAISNQK